MSRITDLNVYLYLRKSRKDLEEEKKATEVGESYDTLERHRKTLLSVAKKERHNILRIYEEVVSGESITERPQIQEMLRNLETSNVDGVLVMDIDRLGRGDMLDQGLLDRAFRYSGAKIITPTEIYDTESETWELVFGIKSIVAREELKAITRRMQRGRVSSASEGKSISKVPPYGYARDENLRLYPDVETAWVVKKMFEMMRDGHGRQAIANELDKLGIKPPNPEREIWSPSSITAIIKNEVYLGRIIWGQVSYSKRNGKYVKKKLQRSQWTIKENAHEPLVSQELFDEANRCHTGRHRPSTVPTKKLSNPLAGILKCAVCGYTMWNQPRKDRPSNFLRCATPTCRSVQKGSALHIVEQRIIDGLSELVEDIEIQSEAKDLSQESDVPYKRILVGKKEKELSELSAQKSHLHDLLERRTYDIETFMERQQNLTERINGLQDEIRNLESEIQKEESRKSNDDEFLPQLRFVLKAYQETTSAERKNVLLKSVLEKVTYLRKKEWVKQEEFELDLFTKINR
jgi:DNA invertase Pin-like site-specific DNA recombinase